MAARLESWKSPVLLLKRLRLIESRRSIWYFLNLAPIVVSLLGVTVLIGWYAHIPRLIQILPDLAPMQHITALAFVLDGIGILALLHRKHRLCGVVGTILSLIGVITLLEYLFGWNTGLDELFIKHYIQTETLHLSRMPPNTASGFTLMGILLLWEYCSAKTSQFKYSYWIFGALILSLGGTALVGYITLIPTAYGWGQFRSMALHTSVGFVMNGLVLISIAFYWSENNAERRRSLTAMVSVLSLGAVFYVFQGYHHMQLQEQQLRLQAITKMAQRLLELQFLALENTFTRLAERRLESQSIMAFRFDLRAYLKDIEALMQIGIWRQNHLQVWEPIIIESKQSANNHCGADYLGIDLFSNLKQQQNWFYKDGYLHALVQIPHSDTKEGLWACLDTVIALNQWLPLPGLDNQRVRLLPVDSLSIFSEWEAGVSLGDLHLKLEIVPIAKDTEIYLRNTLVFLVALLALLLTVSFCWYLFQPDLECINLRQQRRLEQINTELEEFNYVASHDLREPLRTVISFCNLLKKDLGTDLPEKAQRDIVYITEAVERMKKLIDSLLEYSRVGRLNLKIQPVSVHACIQRVQEDLRALIEQEYAEIRVADCPQVMADELALQRVFQNLIHNSIKFHSKQRPNIKIYTLPSQNEQSVILAVKDNGIGIKPEYQQQIFGAFKRLHSVGEYEGSGIGLAVVKKLIERLNGVLWIESELGKGTVFYIRLPAVIGLE